MATYDHLPVYKTSYDLLLILFGSIKDFTKEYKYTLGDKIKNEIVDLIACVYRANSSFDDRLKNIKKSREHIEVVRLYVRLTKDLKLMNLNTFVETSTHIESVSKQLLAWERTFRQE